MALAKLVVFIMPVNIFQNEHLLRDQDDDDDGFVFKRRNNQSDHEPRPRSVEIGASAYWTPLSEHTTD